MIIKRLLKRIFMPTAYQIEIDSWSIDIAMAKWITPRLKELHKHNDGYPDYCFDSFEDWQKQIEEFIWLFEEWQQSDITTEKYWNEKNPNKGTQLYYKDLKRAEKAWADFAKYYNNLWW